MRRFYKNNIKKSVFKLLSKKFSGQFLTYILPEIKPNLEKIMFRTASSPNEYLAAFNLVYKVFVKNGFTQPSSTPFRLAPHHCNPDSRVFIGVFKEHSVEKLIYSVSIFPDSCDGLPMDEDFKPQLDDIRSKGRFIVEAGHLAADPLFKTNTMNIPMLGNKIFFHYANDILKADDIVITTHPKFQWIYQDLLLFTKIGEVGSYGYANGNPAIAMRLDLRTAKDRYRDMFNKNKIKNNFYRFFFHTQSSSISMPENKPVETQLLESVKNLYGIRLKTSEKTIHFKPVNHAGSIRLNSAAYST